MRIAKATATKKDQTYEVAGVLRQAIAALPDDAEGIEALVVQIFVESKATPTQKCDAFWMLDETPGRWGSNYPTWHWKLRRTRNKPEYGRKMFATFMETL